MHPMHSRIILGNDGVGVYVLHSWNVLIGSTSYIMHHLFDWDILGCWSYSMQHLRCRIVSRLGVVCVCSLCSWEVLSSTCCFLY